MTSTSGALSTTRFSDRIPYCLQATDFSSWLGVREVGKARDSYVRGPSRFIVATDRVSAFDSHLGCIPYKGQVVTRMTEFWLNRTSHIIQGHLIACPDPNVLEVQNCTPLPIELVVRGYITGVTPTAMWYQYAKGRRSFAGHALPDGLHKNDKLPSPLVTPSTKAPKGERDETISDAEAVHRGLVSQSEMEFLHDTAIALYEFGKEFAANRGFILVDTKYEFGRTSNGEIVLIDEVHTPDSSRYWRIEEYVTAHKQQAEQLEYDKEYIRLWLASLGFEGSAIVPAIPDSVFVGAASQYAAVFQEITGLSLVNEEGDITQRIEASLRTVLQQP